MPRLTWGFLPSLLLSPAASLYLGVADSSDEC
jgi:hypothetical protein